MNVSKISSILKIIRHNKKQMKKKRDFFAKSAFNKIDFFFCSNSKKYLKLFILTFFEHDKIFKIFSYFLIILGDLPSMLTTIFYLILKNSFKFWFLKFLNILVAIFQILEMCVLLKECPVVLQTSVEMSTPLFTVNYFHNFYWKFWFIQFKIRPSCFSV